MPPRRVAANFVDARTARPAVLFTRNWTMEEFGMSLRHIVMGSVAIATTTALFGWGGGAHAVQPRATAKRVLVSAPSNVTEGDRFQVTARIPNPKQALRVAFEYEETGVYSFESVTTWTTLKTVKVNGHKQVAATVQADAAKEAKFRAVVTYRGTTRSSKSSASRVDYWHWQGLAGGYYTAGSGTDVLGFTMAGRSWNGWHLYAGTSAEDRYTLSGSCKEFKATVGLTDQSADGSTGTVTFSTINPATTAQPVWTSPTLVPGRTVAVTVPLSAPYRFSILGQNTSAPVTDNNGETTTPAAYPAVGDPEFLCHQD